MYGLDENLNMKRITNPSHNIVEGFENPKKGYSNITIGLAVLIVLLLIYLTYKFVKSN